MKCIVCGKKIPDECEICKECNKLMDMLYSKKKGNKEFALKLFREESSRRNKK